MDKFVSALQKFITLVRTCQSVVLLICNLYEPINTNQNPLTNKPEGFDYEWILAFLNSWVRSGTTSNKSPTIP